MDKNGRYLVTGGSGYLGHALIGRMIAQGYKNLTVLARHEDSLMRLKEAYPDVEIIAGDVADPYVCQKACEGKTGIFHLGAFKHVRMAESDTWQCIRTNVIGTSTLLGVTAITKPELFVFISTDKASNVKGVYGATKLLGEKLVQEFARANTATQYRVIRYGNVWGSTGSIAVKWERLMREGKEVVVTEPKATRFYFTVDEAVDLIFACIEQGKDASPMSMKMKAVSLGTVLEACLEVYGGSPVKVIGLQRGENMHETCDGVNFSDEAEQYTKDEFIRKFLCPTK